MTLRNGNADKHVRCFSVGTSAHVWALSYHTLVQSGVSKAFEVARGVAGSQILQAPAGGLYYSIRCPVEIVSTNWWD